MFRLVVGVLVTSLLTCFAIEDPQEFANFGYNPETVSFFGTMAFALLGSWGLVDQIDSIQAHESGKSVSVTWFEVQTASFCSFIIYGMSIESIAVFFQGTIRSIFLIPLTFLLWWYQAWSQIHLYLFGLLVASLGANILLPYNGIFFLAFAASNLGFVLLQPYELFRVKDPGALSIKLILLYGLSSVFWAVYGAVFKDTPILLLGVGYTLVYTFTSGLWLYYYQHTTTRKA